MSIHVLQRTQIVPLPLEECWAFFADPRNLSRITPPWLDFKVLSDLAPQVYAGMIIRYRVRPLLGIPMTWVTEITNVDELRYFSDEQRIGPYRIWHHEHFFTRRGDRSAEARDCVHYALPFGFAGDIVHAAMVRRRIEEIFAYRRQALIELFGEAAEESTGSQTNSKPGGAHG